jgi:hypothetical protein
MQRNIQIHLNLLGEAAIYAFAYGPGETTLLPFQRAQPG